jgi:hypothetical protein
LRVEELKTRMKETNTISGFDIFETITSTPVDLMTADVRLIKKVDDMTEQLVRSSMKCKRYYGQTYYVQNLQSQELIKNSCDEDLARKVIYFIMIKLIQTNMEQAVRVLNNNKKLEKLSL